jgi:tetratricopeptide (TPR) repeat protein
VVGWWRTGSTCIQQGALQQGLRCCEEALALSPVAFDAAMIRAVQAYGRVKLGDAQAGTAALAEAIGWFDRSHLRYTRSVVALWLAEGWLRLGEAPRARAIVGEALAAARELGYRHLEGVAERLLGEALVRDDPRAALERLCRAEEVLQEIGALNEVGKTLVARAELAGASGERPAARELLGRALGIFARLGTLDELSRAELALASLGEHEDG